MKKHIFYRKFANTPLSKRFDVLSNAYNEVLLGMTLLDVFNEIESIDNKLREDEIRREKLLEAVEKFL